MRNSDNSVLNLRRSTDRTSFVSATEAVDIPDWCAQRCKLFDDLEALNDGMNVDLPLPLSMAEIKAWLACSQQVKAVVERGECLFQSPLEQDDDTLTNALKVLPSYNLLPQLNSK